MIAEARSEIGVVCSPCDRGPLAKSLPDEIVTAEHEDTVDALEDAVRSAGHSVERMEGVESLCDALSAGKRWDLVFPVVEGMEGSYAEAEIKCLLDFWGIQYAFADPLASVRARNRATAKGQIRDAGLRTPRFREIRQRSDLMERLPVFPLVVKPAMAGTSAWVDTPHLVSNRDQMANCVLRLLATTLQPVLVEEYLPGPEFVTGILGTGTDAKVLGTVERNPVSPDVFSHPPHAQSQLESEPRCSPAPGGGMRSAVEKLALRAYRALKCRDAGCVEVRLDRKGKPSFMNVDPLPGLHPTRSILPIIAAHQGVNYNVLINSIRLSAMDRVWMAKSHSPIRVPGDARA